jgi:uncharacterized protein YnzC (UPF0291/DUF896 family)
MICDVINGYKELKAKGLTGSEIVEQNVIFAREYMIQHANEFNNIVRNRGNINPFYDKQDKAFNEYCVNYK